MKQILIFCAVAFFCVIQAFSQISISSFVRTAEGEEMDFVNIVVLPLSSPKTLLSSGLTDEKGLFHMNVSADCDSLILKANGMEIAPTEIIIPNKTGRYDIIVTKQSIQLKDIIVKSKKIYSHGDTINYNMASFVSATDQSIADVLKKMPGISVSENGQISYQGKPIKKLYIEGLDLMKGHYGIATNNIDPHNIATVQVLENHQDIKALKDLRPEEQASINLRLKEGVKGVFNLITELGGGYGEDSLWNNSLIATYFRRKSQFLATYKGNNTGEDLAQELHSFDTDYSRTNNITSITMPSAPGIDKRFYYFNRSHSATYNNIYRIGQTGEFGVNAAYLNDRDARRSYSSTTNTLPSGAVNVVDEYMNGLSKSSKAYGDLTYLVNGDTRYLKEQLKIDWFSTDANSRIIAGGDNITQQGKTESYRLFNKFHFTNRNSVYHGYEIYSIVNLEKRPHSLSVSPNLFSDIIETDFLHQIVDYSDFSTENRIGLLSAWRVGNIIIHPNVFFNYAQDKMTSSLSSYHNDLHLDKLMTGLITEMSWRTRKINLSLHLPIGYKSFNLKNHLTSGIVKNHLHAEPQVDLSYKLNSNHNISLKSALNYSTPSIQNLYSNYILTTYRQLSVYDVIGLFEGVNFSNSISYTFKNILSMSFAGFDFNWIRQKPDVLYGSYYDGMVEKVISRRTDEVADMFSAIVRGSRSFDWKRLKIGLSASYSYYDSPLLVQNNVMRYSGKTLSMNGDVSMSPFKWLSLSYAGQYYQSVSRPKGLERMPWIRTLTNKVSLDFNLPCGISMLTSLYNYFNNYNEGDKSFLLLNAEARYAIKRFTFALTCDNLLNRKEYIYSSRTALTESNSIYTIRPRSILFKIRFRVL